jgi:hypothetical protein
MLLGGIKMQLDRCIRIGGGRVRTTVTISDALYAQAKIQAARQGGSVGSVFEAALQAYLDRSRQLAAAELPDLPVFSGGAVRAGVDLNSGAALRALLDEGQDLHALR